MSLWRLKLLFAGSLLAFSSTTYSAVVQSLIDTFFQNPAELSLVKQTKLMAGDLFLEPNLTFVGDAPGGSGRADSLESDNLPYMVTGYRVNKRFVVGVNVTPTGYGHIDWSLNSIVAPISTKTYVIYYRGGIQSSYQVNDDLAIGLGVNLELLFREEINFWVPNVGNQINKGAGNDYSLDVGLYYKINPQHALTFAVYTPVNIYTSGTSILNNTVSRSLRMTATEASVAYLGLRHTLSDKWWLGETVYWSGWSIQKNINFINTATGSFVAPTNWKDVWSFQIGTRYAASEKFALLGGAIYETNPNPTLTNSIAYPLAATTFVSAGLDFKLMKTLNAQLIYGYGLFTPNAKIDTHSSHGSISANTQAVILQFVYQS